jgi:hypothetical protein
MKNAPATVGNSMVGLQRLNIELLYEPAIPLLGMHAKELTEGSETDTCILIFLAALSATVKRWKQPM